MWLAQCFGTLLFLLQDIQLFQVLLTILLTFATQCHFWSAFPKVFNSCPNTNIFSKTSMDFRRSWVWSAMNSAKNCHWKSPLPFWLFWPLILCTINPSWQHYRCLSLEACSIQAYTIFWFYAATFFSFHSQSEHFLIKKPPIFILNYRSFTQKVSLRNMGNYFGYYLCRFSLVCPW